jgi:hypothetical protein
MLDEDTIGIVDIGSTDAGGTDADVNVIPL